MMRAEDKSIASADRVLTVQKLGASQELTPEGYLLCKDVGLARIGQMDYKASEMFSAEDIGSVHPDTRITVDRFPEDVFAQQFLDSLEGKSVTMLQHPPEDVNPENWKLHEVGICLHPRRGTGANDDLIIGDLLIKDADGIRYARQNPEVSLGYQADYQEYIDSGTGQKRWKQVPLLGNHIALVDAGRCGSRCAIHDSIGDPKMKTRKTMDKAAFEDWRKRMSAAAKANDEAAMEELMAEVQPQDAEGGMPGPGDDDDVHIHLDQDLGGGDDTMGGGGMTRDEEAHGRLDALEGRLSTIDESLSAISKHVGYNASDEIPAEVEGEMAAEVPGAQDVKSIKDSVPFSVAFQEVRAGAEILAPGITLPTFVRDAKPRTTFDQMCALRRTALELSNNTPEGRSTIEAIHGRPLKTDGMKCGDVRVLFNAVVAVRKTAASTIKVGDVNAGKPAVKAIQTIADLNAANRKHYGQSA